MKKNKILKQLKGISRQESIDAGLYNCFKTKVVPNKKKKDSKESCRKYK